MILAVKCPVYIRQSIAWNKCQIFQQVSVSEVNQKCNSHFFYLVPPCSKTLGAKEFWKKKNLVRADITFWKVSAIFLFLRFPFFFSEYAIFLPRMQVIQIQNSFCSTTPKNERKKLWHEFLNWKGEAATLSLDLVVNEFWHRVIVSIGFFSFSSIVHSKS